MKTKTKIMLRQKNRNSNKNNPRATTKIITQSKKGKGKVGILEDNKRKNQYFEFYSMETVNKGKN